MRLIRSETPDDRQAIRQIHSRAFRQPHEADLVDALRHHRALTISLVAVQAGRPVGHIAFSPVTITSATGPIDALGLGPMAVLPPWQGQGIGSQLVEAGLEACRQTSCGVVVVLGHPTYYPRWGFAPAKPYGIMWDHDAPEEAFMVKELQTGALARTRGVVRYRPEFDQLA